jgi:hypothetical protein
MGSVSIEELCVSAYIQGMMDAQQLPKDSKPTKDMTEETDSQPTTDQPQRLATTPCSSCLFQAQMGITLLDAKYLDPKCWKGCQGLVHAHRIEALVAAGDHLRELASMGALASFDDLQAWDSAAGTNDKIQP